MADTLQPLPNEAKFSISLVGDVTGTTWSGAFKMKLRLSHREQLKRDEYRRSLLGADPDHASPRALSTAECFSEITAHLVEMPKWWILLDNGMDLEDDNVVAEIYNNVIKELVNYRKLVSDRSDKGKVDLKKISDELAIPPMAGVPQQA